MIRRQVALAIVLAVGLAGPAIALGGPMARGEPAAHGPRSLAAPSVPMTHAPEDARRASGSQVRLLVATIDPAAMPNDGLRLNISPFIEPVLGADTSFQAAAEETIGAYDAVFGLFANTGTAPIPFFSVFSNTTDATVHLAYWPTASPAPGPCYDFELARANGTVWELHVDHELFGGNTTEADFDFGVPNATWLPGLSFSEIALAASGTSAPATLTTTLAFAVLQPSGWYLPDGASATFSPASGTTWGVEGRLQHPTLPPGEIVSGTDIAPILNGTSLWAGGRVPVEVDLSVPSSTRGLTTVAVSVAVTTTSGAPIPGATVYLGDPLGGTFLPASLVTGDNGSGGGGFSAPNVTANASDLLSATVTTFGYDGFTDVSVAVAPAIQVLVVDLSPRASVSPGGSIDLAFETEGLSGSALPGVFLTLEASDGSVAPAYGVTGSDGTFDTTLSAPNATGYVLVRATVDSGGEWGATAANVSVAVPVASGLTTGEIGALVGAAAAVVLVLAVIVLRRRAARRPPVPPMRLPRRASVAPPRSAAEPGPSPSRTPPEGGAP